MIAKIASSKLITSAARRNNNVTRDYGVSRLEERTVKYVTRFVIGSRRDNIIPRAKYTDLLTRALVTEGGGGKGGPGRRHSGMGSGRVRDARIRNRNCETLLH